MDEKLAPYREHQICVFCFYFLALTSNPVTTSEAELLANSNFFFFLFLFHSRNMCQVQTVKFICCCSSPPHTVLAEGEISNAITPKPPRKVAQDALILWEGAEDNEEAKLAKAGTLLKYFVGQGAQLQCPWCGRWLHPSWDHHQLFDVGPHTRPWEKLVTSLTGSIKYCRNLASYTQYISSVAMDGLDGWIYLPWTLYLRNNCGQSVIEQESQRDESAKPIHFSSFLLFLQLLCLILIWFFQRQTF